ncbi:S-adenosyl-L-methionine-dependent methyltransferase [Trema orientale]|uniref:S-adenosyl-L-methionine-dependent methyltransferase n=1 Tax=Trema orientale TaxID=63057 RepID=A0A2P5FDW9_TREOI|nr:S-adenosyl-L-methionine-dependent methyltransferase [Trema orientale]
MDGILQVPYDATVKLALASLERNLLPDAVIRRLTRLLLASRLRSGYKSSVHLQLSDLLRFVHSLKEMPIAIKTDEPKAQHYELPTSFFKLVLGDNFKYSCCYFERNSSTLEEAERAMLELYCERSKLEDGQTVLDVGCGWGSLSLYIAQKYRNCKVTGICNSATQKAHIDERCRDLELDNVEIVVADISTFEMEGSFDRIFSIEMFEHMKNYKELLKKISGWMKEDSLLFVHHFCHKTFAYHFEVYFFQKMFC